MEVYYSSNTFKMHCAEAFRPLPRHVGQFLRHLHLSIEIPTIPAIRASTSRARHRLQTTEWFEDSRRLELDADPILKRFLRPRRAQYTGYEYMSVDKHKTPFDPPGRLGKSPSDNLVHTWNNQADRYTSWQKHFQHLQTLEVVIRLKCASMTQYGRLCRDCPNTRSFFLARRRCSLKSCGNNVCKFEGSPCDGQCAKIAENALRDMFLR